jgi:hypothetical protein
LQKISGKSDLRFKQVNNNIIVRLEKENPAENQDSQSIPINGRVLDDGGNPLPGVSVLIKGTSAGTITDLDGSFVLDVVDNDDVLVFSYMGFSTQEIQVAGRSTITVTLLENVESLGEVVVTALGIRREAAALPYAVTKVEGDNFTKAREIIWGML